jgi:preprotein translocase subunit Sec61beta
VFWSFFGVRKGNSMRQDAVKIRPHQVILVGVALAAVFVFALLLVVRIILRSAGA